MATILPRVRIAILLAALASAAMLPPAVPAARSQGAAAVQTGPSGLPLPRFVSLKTDRINVRAGPGQDHQVSWIFARPGLPVEIVSEFENWRRIRDSEGAEGWVFHSLLSGRRTALVAPWSKERTLSLHRNPSANGAVTALVEPGVLVDLVQCDGSWCRVTVSGVSGWLQQEMLWGVYPKETLK